MMRLSPLDSSFLRIETPAAHMHVGWVSTLDLPRGTAALDTDALRVRIAGRLHLAPRFRQLVARVPFALAEPVWCDDPDFDLRRHVREVEPDAVLRPRDFAQLVDDLLSVPLDRSRPLWELWVVPRLQGRRAAVIGKVHHAMVDGVAAVELGALLFDTAADAEPNAPAPWSPRRVDRVRLAADAVADVAADRLRATRRAAATPPARALRAAASAGQAAAALAEPAPPSYLNVSIGPRRTLATHSVALDRLLALREAAGVTLNDAVLAMCAGALREFALRLGHPAGDLRVMVPVDVRRDASPGELGNRIAFAFTALPVGDPSPARRLAAVSRGMDAVKAPGRLAGTRLLLEGLGVLPEAFKDGAARMAASPRLFNLTISNVRGPRMPLYASGARVRSIFPVVPIAARHALSIGVLSYDGHAHIALYADPGVLPGARVLPILLDDALLELERAVGRPAEAARAHAAPRRRSAGAGAAARRRRDAVTS